MRRRGHISEIMTQLKYFTLISLAFGGLFGFATESRAQIFRDEIIGYYNLALSAGDNLIANQLLNPGGNSLNNLFAIGTPQGATFTKWNAATQAYLPISTYDADSGWSINYDLNLGEGGLLHTPTDFDNTFVGYYWPEFNYAEPFTPPVISGSGLFLLASCVPFSSATFNDVVGRSPYAGEYVQLLDALTQTTTITTFSDGAWTQGDPLLNAGQAAFFHLGEAPALGAPPIPEPSTYALFGLGLVAWGWRVVRRTA